MAKTLFPSDLSDLFTNDFGLGGILFPQLTHGKGYASSLKNLDPNSPTGFGNNKAHLTWGQGDQTADPNDGVSNHAFIRTTGVYYKDNQTGEVVTDRPDANLISDGVFKIAPNSDNNPSLLNKHGLNENFAFFGQLVAHDTDQATQAPANGTIPNAGSFFGDLTRSNYLTDSNGVRQQTNDVTAFLDLNPVYGSSQTQATFMRQTDSHGNLKAELMVGGDGLLARVHDVASAHGVSESEVLNTIIPLGGAPSDLFYSGDNRVNQNAELVAQTLVWVKEHNHQVELLRTAHSDWSEDQLYTAAKAITTGEWQHVVYDEYLGKLLGKDALGSYKGYDSSVNPTISNEFAAAGFRFGHDEQSNQLFTVGADGKPVDTIKLAEAFQTLDRIGDSEAFDGLLRGLTSEHGQQVDGQVVDGVRQQLFGIPGVTLDLETFDILRGRDHGLGTINQVRHDLGLSEYSSFHELTGEASDDVGMAAKLKDVYGTIDTLDLVVGGMVEKHYKDSELGETFWKIVADQFSRLRAGDSNYYENELKSDPSLIAQIKATTFSDILARNSGEDHYASDAFAAVNRIVVDKNYHDVNVYGDNQSSKLVSSSPINDDLIIIKDGVHKVWGYTGKDTFAVDQGEGSSKVKVTIADFNTKQDQLDLTQFGLKDNADLFKHEKLVMADGKLSTMITNDHGDQITLIGVKALTATNFVHDHSQVTSLV